MVTENNLIKIGRAKIYQLRRAASAAATEAPVESVSNVIRLPGLKPELHSERHSQKFTDLLKLVRKDMHIVLIKD
jgi:hypothetical protein